MTWDVTVARIIYSGYNPNIGMFCRKLIGADGNGYEFHRPESIDVQALQIESAIAADVSAWLEEGAPKSDSVLTFTPRFDPNRPVNWLPPIEIARPSRTYWRPERKHAFTRVWSRCGRTFHLYTPITLAAEILAAHQVVDTKLRKAVYGSDLHWVCNGHQTPPGTG